MDFTFDLVVVGGGLIGSACARHASLRDGLKVALIGPKEPQDRADTEVFGCWHDEGRLYYKRKKWSTPAWGHFSQESVNRFKDIKDSSGVDFFEDCGYLDVAGPKHPHFNEWCKDAERLAMSSNSQVLSPEEIPSVLPFLQLPGIAVGSYDQPGQGAGYLSPRKLVFAQQKLAMKQGCVVLSSIAKNLRQTKTGWMIQTEDGLMVSCTWVVLCQGTYTGLSFVAKDLLPPLDLTYTAQTTALMEVDEEEAQRLKDMPSMVVQMEPIRYTYILPPIRYPNNRIYIKFGAHDLDRVLTTVEQVTNHYRVGPDPAHVTKLVNEARKLIPGLGIKSVVGDSCVTSNTPGKVAPFIDAVLPGVVLAAGGSGHAAMGSDEIGRLASILALDGTWDSKLPKELCRVRFKNMAHL